MTSRAPQTDVAAGKLIIDVLGSGSGVPTASRDTSSLLIGVAEGWTLIDCPGSVVHKLALRGLMPERIRRVLLTHDHVDHVYGLPHLLHALAIGGSSQPLEIAAPAETLATVDAVVRAYRLDRSHYPELLRREIPARENTEVAATADFSIRCSPALHGRETVSVRVDVAGASVCYSSDTRSNDATVALARGVDLLLHDCGGTQERTEALGSDHASAAEAGAAARRAGAGRLVLIHLGMDETQQEACRREARAHFGDRVILARDGDRWELGSST